MTAPTSQTPTQANNYAVAVGTSTNSAAVPVLFASAPSSTTIGPPYPIGKRAIVPSTNSEYTLTSFSSSGGSVTANWTVSASPTGIVSTLTGDSGGAISPTAGNINLLGTANQITTVGSGSTITYSLIGPYTPATYTAHGVLMGEGTSSIVASAAGTSGQVFTSGGASADGAYQNLGVNSGLTNHGIVLAQGNSAFVATAVGLTGTVLIGNTAADPSFSANPVLTSVTFGAGSALAAYVEATTFVPTLTFGGASVGMTFALQEGYYTKIGKMVFFSINLVLTAKGSSTGTALISGLPFAARTSAPLNFAYSVASTDLTLTAAYTARFTTAAGATTIALAESNGGTVTVLADTNFGNTTALIITGSYMSQA